METNRVNRLDPEVWRRLEEARPIGENLTARLADPETSRRLQCAIDAEGRRHLLVALDATEEEFKDTQSRGVTIATRDLVVHGQLPVRYLDIECIDAGGHSAFDIIGRELAEELSETRRSPVEIAKRLLAKWRRFWGELPKTILSREQLFGLFAELWFLSFWLLPRVGTAQSVQRWRGPFGSRHDFEWQGKSVEVKATSSTRGRIHLINGIEQLLPPEKGELFLFSLRLREEAGATNTLPNLIDKCRNLFQSEPDSLSTLETGVARAGYSPAHDEEYNKIALRVAEEALFAVRRDFPRITERNFVSGIPSGVETIRYEINLNAFDHLRVATSPDEAVVLL
jgi:hypothetical protein